jgi:RNA polymerase sigma-70 factor (ECF subfamily)
MGPAEALALIEPLAGRLGAYFPYHGARGHFLLQLGRKADARAAFNQAIGLANTPAEAALIRQHLDRLGEEAGIPG